MAKIKVTRKELKQDELRNLGTDLLEFWNSHRTWVVAVACVCVVSFVALKLYQGYKAKVLEESNYWLTQIIIGSGQALLPIEEERRNQIIDQTASICDRVRTMYPNSEAAQHAHFMTGNCLFLRKEFDKAISTFQRYTEEAEDSSERARGYLALGYAYENRYFYEKDPGLLEQAESCYVDAASEGGGGYLTYQALLCRARLLELMGRNEEAVALYRQVKSERGGTSLKFAPRTEKTEDPQVAAFRREMRSRLDLLSYSETAQLRLDRLLGSSDTTGLQ